MCATGPPCCTQSIVLKFSGKKDKDDIKSVCIIKPQMFLRDLLRTWTYWKSLKSLQQFLANFSLPLFPTCSWKPSPTSWCWVHQWWSDAAVITAVLFSGTVPPVCKVRPLSPKCFQLLIFVHQSPFRANRMAWQVQCSTCTGTYRMSTSVSLICKMEKQIVKVKAQCGKSSARRNTCCTETGDTSVVGLQKWNCQVFGETSNP